jgi:hypothetical protein
MAALGSTIPERQHMNKAYSHNDHHWGITVTIKRRYHVKHLYYRSDRTCFNFFSTFYYINVYIGDVFANHLQLTTILMLKTSEILQ